MPLHCASVVSFGLPTLQAEVGGGWVPVRWCTCQIGKGTTVDVERCGAGATDPCVIAIGMFDGLHKGHRHILSLVDKEGKKRGLRRGLLTFDPHPRACLSVPDGEPHEALTTLAHRLQLIEQTGMIDIVRVLPFTESLRAMTPRVFAGKVLHRNLKAETVVVGRNFRFGHKRTGDTEALQLLGAEFGFAVVVAPLLTASEGASISSTAIRNSIRLGDVDHAAWLLDRPYELRGEFIGKGVVRFSAGLCLPAPGQYEGAIEEPMASQSGSIPVRIHANGPVARESAVHVTFTRSSRPSILPGTPVSLRFLKRRD
jgi:riboflavin kinase/FMN adenylyltransferase